MSGFGIKNIQRQNGALRRDDFDAVPVKQPEFAIGVLVDPGNFLIGLQSIFFLGEQPEIVSVVPVEAITRADPNEPFLVFEYGGSHQVGEALFSGQFLGFEEHCLRKGEWG